jgi:hypothetical protein
MVKKSFLLVILFAFISLAAGCVTVYTDGCCPDKSAGQGSVKSSPGNKFCETVKNADDWVRTNIW